MFFLPLKADIPLSRLSYLTFFIAILCLFIYWQQTRVDKAIATKIDMFCSVQDGRTYQIVMDDLIGDADIGRADACKELVGIMHYVNNREQALKEIVSKTPKFSIMSTEETHAYITEYLQEMYDEFSLRAPKPLTNRLQYDPTTFSIPNMLTSVFAHGSWSHVIGNLFFFFAFAATVEIILGSFFYVLMIAALAIGTNVVYAIAISQMGDSLPTLGLSGVVMGMIGLFVYFVPRERILCFVWLVILARRLRIPAWLIASWYFGWDLYDLTTNGMSSGVNLIAHVSGFILGYLLGAMLFSWRKKEVLDEIKARQDAKELSAVIS